MWIKSDEALFEARQTLLRSGCIKNVSESSNSDIDSTDWHSQIDTTTDGGTGTGTDTGTGTGKGKDLEKEIDK